MRTLTYQDAARELLSKALVELEAGDVRQVSEKGWGAAAQMVKAVAESRGWRHNSHVLLLKTINLIACEIGDQRIKTLFGMAGYLHQNFYENRADEEFVTQGLQDVRDLLDRLNPLVDDDFSRDREG
ncbi:MAG: PaREP1 family protein [bacterium]|nr:PaREP1 family protein [bacterium]MCY3580511.1 PaREP1 family protein [bacterium]MDE0643374.1 PaREP1 family protein [bacterium]